MKADWRILASVALFTALGAGILSTIRNSSNPNDSEVDPLAGQRASINAQDGLIIELTSTETNVLVENCETDRFSEKFFLHAFPINDRNIPSEGFHNFDFQLDKIRGFETTRNGNKYCLHPIPFNRFKIKEVQIGQFSMPGGRCCEILWSTNIKL